MRVSKKAMLAAALIAGAAAMTGCTADTKPVATPTPQAVQQQTAQPATAQPTAAQPETAQTASPEQTAEAAEEPESSSLALLVDGAELETDAALERGEILLPLEAAAQALGWTSDTEETREETQTKRVIALEKDGSRITVSYTVSDNTIRQISWQKDGLLIPVDTRITTIGDLVYVPSAFFEEAMEVSVTRTQKGVEIISPKPMDTPQTSEQSSGENG